jgi:hypothetical protein
MLLTPQQQPRWSEQPSNTSKVQKHVIIRNRYVEISSDESGMEASPTPQLAPPVATLAVDKTGNVINS